MSRSSQEPEPEVLDLNVGGRIFTTTLSTLRSSPTNSRMGRMFAFDWDGHRDENGRVFIDRDGEVFEYILEYLRHGKWGLLLPQNEHIKQRIAREALYYGLVELSEQALYRDDSLRVRLSFHSEGARRASFTWAFVGRLQNQEFNERERHSRITLPIPAWKLRIRQDCRFVAALSKCSKLDSTSEFTREEFEHAALVAKYIQVGKEAFMGIAQGCDPYLLQQEAEYFNVPELVDICTEMRHA